MDVPSFFLFNYPISIITTIAVIVRVITIVTGETCRLIHTARMTCSAGGASMIDATTTFISNAGV